MEKKASTKTLRRFDLISQSCEDNSEFKARDAIPVNVKYFTIVFFLLIFGQKMFDKVLWHL